MVELYLGGGPATADEAAVLDAVLPHGAPQHRLLPALHALDGRVGWISRAAVDEIARRLDVAPAVIYGVASFYGMFSTTPRPPTVAYVCDDVPCLLAGAQGVVEELARSDVPESRAGADRRRETGDVPVQRTGEATPYAWERSPCLGLCDHAPAALVGGQARLRVDADAVHAALRARSAERRLNGGGLVAAGPPPSCHVASLGEPRLLARVGRVDPYDLDAYRAIGGFTALRRAVSLGREAVLARVKASGLIGRGGAAFPVALKWEAVAHSSERTRYLVCNADESETGTFKDRVLCEHDPYALLESIAIASYTCGVEHAYVYLRGEYPHAAEVLAHAIATAEARGFLGRDVMGLGFDLTVELRRGAGAYICGEETALFNSLEGRRGEPRSKPPFPTVNGLFGKPTVVNNVETLLNLPVLLNLGVVGFRMAGTERSTGTKLVALSGHVQRPGVYEVPFGTSLRTLVEDLGGGVPDGRGLLALQCGGAAGTFLRPDDLDLPLTFEDLRARGATVGSGAVVVLDETVDLHDVLVRTAEFFAHESCGQCVPCRVGTVRQLETLGRDGGGAQLDVALLGELGQVMRDASICGLGQTAASAVLSAVRELPDALGLDRHGSREAHPPGDGEDRP